MPWHADLGTAEPEPHQPVGPQAQRGVQGDVSGTHARLTGNVEDPPHHDPEIGLGLATRILQRLAVCLCRDANGDRCVRRTGQLDISDVLGNEVASHVVGEGPDVLGRTKQVNHREIDLDEMTKVREGEEVSQQRRIGRHRSIALVPGGQLGHSAGRGRSDVMDVKLSLGQALDECHEPTLSTKYGEEAAAEVG